MCKDTLVTLLTDFSAEILQVRRKLHGIISVERKKLPTKNTLPDKVSFRTGAEVHCFPDKPEIKEFITTRQAL